MSGGKLTGSHSGPVCAVSKLSCAVSKNVFLNSRRSGSEPKIAWFCSTLEVENEPIVRWEPILKHVLSEYKTSATVKRVYE